MHPPPPPNYSKKDVRISVIRVQRYSKDEMESVKWAYFVCDRTRIYVKQLIQKIGLNWWQYDCKRRIWIVCVWKCTSWCVPWIGLGSRSWIKRLWLRRNVMYYPRQKMELKFRQSGCVEISVEIAAASQYILWKGLLEFSTYASHAVDSGCDFV